MPRRDGKPGKRTSRRLNVRVAIYAPPDPNDDANRGEFGEVTIEPSSRTFVAYETVSIIPAVAAPKVSAGVLKTANGFAVEMRRRADIAIGYQLDVLGGPYSGRTLFVSSVDKDAGDLADTFILLCN